METRVCDNTVVRAERCAGQWTQYRVWCEVDGKPIGWETVTTDPHGEMETAAARLRAHAGIREPTKAAEFAVASLLGPMALFGLLGWLVSILR
jgi:hypothetical protein